MVVAQNARLILGPPGYAIDLAWAELDTHGAFPRNRRVAGERGMR